jgi:MinD superfamily P-loop ATPase
MIRIVFLSGKGGTGKTTLAAAFAARGGDLVLVDADVDAANLHLVFRPEIEETGAYSGSKVAVRDDARCTTCGACREVCRFGAVDETFAVDPLLCEGCGACVTACPADALTLVEQESGTWYVGRAAGRPMAGAELHPGEEVSGKLVSVVKEKADGLAERADLERIAIDGSPGIGCPVIASTTGAQAAVLVTEPSRSGLHDLDRILGVVRHFGIPAHLVINKADLSEPLAAEIEAYAEEQDLSLLGRIPYDERVVGAIRVGRNPVEDPESPAGRAMAEIVARLVDALDRTGKEAE